MGRYISKGRLHNFKKYELSFKKHNIDYEVERYGQTAKIILNNGNVYVFSDNSDSEIVNACRFVAINASKWVRNNEDKLKDIKSCRPIKLFERQTIRENIGKKVVAIDMNHCYWRIAYNHGIISKKTYFRYVEKTKKEKEDKDLVKKNKRRKLVSIGNLNKSIVQVDKNGRSVSRKKPTAKAWNYILYQVQLIHKEIKKELEEELLWWSTDEAVTHVQNKSKVIKIFKKYNMLYKVDYYKLIKIEKGKLKYYSTNKEIEKTLPIAFTD